MFERGPARATAAVTDSALDSELDSELDAALNAAPDSRFDRSFDPTAEPAGEPRRPAALPLRPMIQAPWFRRLGDALLTTDPVQRVRLAQAGLATALMFASVLGMQYVVWLGDAPTVPVRWWTLLSLGGLLVFFGAIRAGWTLELPDPSLTLHQMVYAIACAAGGYALAGPVRGAVFPVLMVILMFGMFQLSARAVAQVSLYAVLLFGLVMLVMTYWQPQVYTASVEAGHFLMLATMLPAVSLLTARLSRIRERLQRGKNEIQAAMAHIQELATRDEITGLINRRHMLELLEQERQRCVRSGHTFCLAMLDIDNFKRINDQHGHDAGDEVLRSFAREARTVVRISDTLARWGGEVFVMMLTNTRAALGRAGVERLREHIAAYPRPVAGQVMGITLSAGLTEHIAGESIDAALERAERAMQDAKAAGSNRVVFV